MPELKKTAPLLLAALFGAALLHFLTPAPVAAQSSDGGRRYVAVAGPYQEGVSVLYVLDQVDQRLAVYEARGGAPNSRRVALVGVRNVALDTELDGYNDESDYSYKDLEELLQRRRVVNK
jgi:hypothetical protein